MWYRRHSGNSAGAAKETLAGANSEHRSHNPSTIKDNVLEGEEGRKVYDFCLPLEQDCRGLRELEGSNKKDGDMRSKWITVICRRERHRFWRLRGFVKEQEVKEMVIS